MKRKRKKKISKKKNKRIFRRKKKFKKTKNYRKKIKKNIKKYKKKKKNKKTKLPLDRIKSLKLPRFKIKKPKIKFKKKQFFKIKKKAKQVTKIKFQQILNFILAPVFKAYDNYFEEKKIKEEEKLNLEIKQRELKSEEKLARERTEDLRKFIRQEQAILRREQAEKRRNFLEKIKLEKKIELFRKREHQEIKSLEKLALQEQREDYKPVQERLEKIKEKYRLIREQKIRERVEALGVEITDADTKEDILKKEKEYSEQRQTIEIVLESFYRSANSLVFQLNRKNYIPKHKSILRVIDRRYESNECFIRYDDSPDEDWLILIYLEDSDAEKGKIIVENKTNPDKHETKSFETKEIFTYSDYLVDSMTAHIDRERQKKVS